VICAEIANAEGITTVERFHGKSGRVMRPPAQKQAAQKRAKVYPIIARVQNASKTHGELG